MNCIYRIKPALGGFKAQMKWDNDYVDLTPSGCVVDRDVGDRRTYPTFAQALAIIGLAHETNTRA